MTFPDRFFDRPSHALSAPCSPGFGNPQVGASVSGAVGEPGRPFSEPPVRGLPIAARGQQPAARKPVHRRPLRRGAARPSGRRLGLQRPLGRRRRRRRRRRREKEEQEEEEEEPPKL
ncbi:unnamed protein product [Prorocentrum cordatum]|uniref:Uncharacterized protein n=1 Tax=Prorocentrum cordatum TaxID=2364126 RepID=A0ABN9WJG5_9DINO|nr:unnamed protein product [Polarella glacialis]